MRIRARLIAGFSALIIILLVLTGTSYTRLNMMKTQLDRIYDREYTLVKTSSELRRQTNASGRILTNTVQLQSTQNITGAKQQLTDKMTLIYESLAVMEEQITTPQEKIMFSEIDESLRSLLAYQSQTLELAASRQGDVNLDERLIYAQQNQEQLLELLDNMTTYNDTRMQQNVTEARQQYMDSIQMMIVLIVGGLVLGGVIVWWIISRIHQGFTTMNNMLVLFAQDKFTEIQDQQITSKDELGEIAIFFQQLTNDLQSRRKRENELLQQQKDRTWISSNLARITELFHGVYSLKRVAELFISEFTPIIGAQYGSLYICGDSKEPNELYLAGSYASDSNHPLPEKIKFGEGLIGQVAVSHKPIELTQVPEQYISIQSSLGSKQASHIMIVPILFEDELLGVIEVANLHYFSAVDQQLLQELSVSLGIVLNNISRRMTVEELLRESQTLAEELQSQSEELQAQQEELRQSNERLEKQTKALRRSEDLLQQQQEELEQFNTELIAKTRALEEQVQAVREKNIEINHNKDELERHSAELVSANQYKSQFLANMSHELRTPLNSLLILSQFLAENEENNLTSKQIQYAKTIHMSGVDLLKMIDEILDLSKVDAGKMEIVPEPLYISEISEFAWHNFGPLAQDKQIKLNIVIDNDLPDYIVSDRHRMIQIMRNLLSNAFKFTKEGEVGLHVWRPSGDQLPEKLPKNQSYVAFSVKDTGIGIPPEKQEIIFEAFKQVDGTTSRKYGGTGLGLSISRELARLLKGCVQLTSVVGEGSIFTLYLPEQISEEISQVEDTSFAEVAATSMLEAIPAFIPQDNVTEVVPEYVEEVIQDDRHHIEDRDKVMLIIEDDHKFADILLEMSRNYGFKTLVAMKGDTGLQMAREYVPDAIILDIQLPVLDGWSVLNALKSNAATRHIPVHVISVIDDAKQGLKMGAIAYLRKPASREQLEGAFNYIESYTTQGLKHLLIVEGDSSQRQSIIKLIDSDDVVITAVSTGTDAVKQLTSQKYDCMILDLHLQDMDGFELLDQIRGHEGLNDLPIIIYSSQDMDCNEATKLRKYAESIIIKDVKSPERLLDETTLFLHRVESKLPEDKRKILQKLHNKEEIFKNKKILLVDDDVRNVFALSSMLEKYQIQVICAENGKDALAQLDKHDDIDLILMDMMMPEMDGYEAMSKIREMPKFKRLPIIALTAKAMKEDRFKCIEAGASDYVSKPVQSEQLLSLMSVWLYS